MSPSLVSGLDQTGWQARRTKSRTLVSPHEIGVCGIDVRTVRLLRMTAATTTYLVARRHVDLGRTRSMMCMSQHSA